MTSPLDDWRTGLQLTQEQASKRLKLAQPYYSRLERGKRLPGGRVMITLRKAHISVDALIDYAIADQSSGRCRKRVA